MNQVASTVLGTIGKTKEDLVRQSLMNKLILKLYVCKQL